MNRKANQVIDNLEEKVSEVSANQKQTSDCFSFKWNRTSSYDTPEVRKRTYDWLLERYCNNDPIKLEEWFKGEGKKILDAGCGAGAAAELLFGKYLKDHKYIGVDISDAVEIAKERISQYCKDAEFIKGDISKLQIPDNSIDIIFSEGVLHHTDNTETSFLHLAKKIRIGGRFMFYIYKKKSPIREFTDDFVRDKIKYLSDEEAWKELEPFTKLGISLGKLNQVIDIEEDVPILGIKKGSYDLQRFFYWNICKMYYRPEYSLDEMNHVNFDWFRPSNCHRHTLEELKHWCEKANLKIESINDQESGITIVALKL